MTAWGTRAIARKNLNDLLREAGVEDDVVSISSLPKAQHWDPLFPFTVKLAREERERELRIEIYGIEWDRTGFARICVNHNSWSWPFAVREAAWGAE